MLSAGVESFSAGAMYTQAIDGGLDKTFPDIPVALSSNRNF